MNSSAWVSGSWAADSWGEDTWVAAQFAEFGTSEAPKAHLARLFFRSIMR